jgi:hypothetical protein
LHDTPHGLPKVGHDAHELQTSPIRLSDRIEVLLQEGLVGGVVEPVVHREVRQVEEHAAHPGVLVIDDEHPLPLADEVRIEEIVVARPRNERAEGFLDLSGHGEQAPEGLGDPDTVAYRSLPVPLHDPKRGEGRGKVGAAVKGAHGRQDPAQHASFPHGLLGDGLPVDEPCHQRAKLREIGHHFRTDPACRGGLRGPTLRLPVDPQEVGVLPGQPDHEGLSVHLHPEVLVGDPAGDGSGLQTTGLRPAGHGPNHGAQGGIQERALQTVSHGRRVPAMILCGQL